jgi:CRP-like cAMP-binding protein
MSRSARHDIARHLAKAPLFGALSAEARGELAARSRVVSLSAHERLWSASEEAMHVGVVLAGRLKLVHHVADREVIVDVALPGETLGEVAFALSSTYQSTVVCLRRARVLLVPTDSLRQVVQRERHTLEALAVNLAAQVQRLMRLVQDLSAGNVERRLARVLVNLVERSGEPFPGGVYVPLRLRRADLAALAATTVESVSRKIGTWSRRGWLVAQPVGYLIRDLPALRSVAEASAGEARETRSPPDEVAVRRRRSRMRAG